ncbi:hypothetical protein N9J94_02120 [Planktomarina sp.]|nr:hypothetical protein [Planktomarina sp.]MDA9100039.1 hypothetical protein [Planktomarina sp.]
MSSKLIERFHSIDPTDENYWRAINLFGRNVASYKFSLAKSLLELSKKQGSKLIGKKQPQQIQKQHQYINRSKNGYHELIDFIADSVARQEWISEMVPPSTSQALAIEIKKVGGLVSWANGQSSYKKILNGKKRRLRNSQNHSN